MGRSLSWVYFNCLTEVGNRPLQVLDSSFLREVMTAQIGLLCRWVWCRFASCRRPETRQFRLDVIGDGIGNLCLQFEHISQVARVGLRPQMLVGARIYQLSRDAHLITRT